MINERQWVEVLVGAFNQEKALVGAFSVIVKLQTLQRFVFSSSVECMTPRQPRIKRVFSGYCFSGNKKTNIFIIYLNQTILL